MRLLPTVIAAATITILSAPSAFAMDKMDADAWLKMIFHGKPGAMWHMTMPTMPKGKAVVTKTGMHMPMMWPWWPMATK